MLPLSYLLSTISNYENSGRADADFGGGVSIFNLQFQTMKIRGLEADFVRGTSIYNVILEKMKIREGRS